MALIDLLDNSEIIYFIFMSSFDLRDQLPREEKKIVKGPVSSNYHAKARG